MNRMEFFSVREMLPDDTLHELRRARARNTQFDKEISEYKKNLEENDAMDEGYKMLMLGFADMEERFVPEKKMPDEDGVNECDPELSNRACDVEIQLEYEHEHEHERQSNLAKKNNRLTKRKSTSKAYRVENTKPDDMVPNLQLEDDCYAYVHKDSEKAFKSEPRRLVNVARKQKVGPSNQVADVQRKRKHDEPPGALKKTNSPTKKKVMFEVDKAKVASGAPNDMELNLNNQCDSQPRRNVSRATKQNVGPSKQTPTVENRHPTQLGKLTDEVKDSSNDMMPNYHDLHLHQNVKLQDEIELNYGVNVDVIKERKDDNDSDVEILDSEAIIEKGTSSTFVPSKKVQERMEELRGSGEFRKQVLNVLRKPFDKDEYNMHQEAVKCYLDHHPDLRGKLTKYRYKRGRRLTIYRGFFFWLQNLTQEGSFKPWMDRECLVVEPEYP